jgi:hypothetical protein
MLFLDSSKSRPRTKRSRLLQTPFQPSSSAQNTHTTAMVAISGIFTAQDRKTFLLKSLA